MEVLAEKRGGKGTATHDSTVYDVNHGFHVVMKDLFLRRILVVTARKSRGMGIVSPSLQTGRHANSRKLEDLARIPGVHNANIAVPRGGAARARRSVRGVSSVNDLDLVVDYLAVDSWPEAGSDFNLVCAHSCVARSNIAEWLLR